jgi:hypothetical protein
MPPRLPRAGFRQRLEGQHDQRVAGKHRERLAERPVDRGFAAPNIGVVEAGKIVMDERGTVQELDGSRSGVGGARLAVAAGHRDGQGKARPDASAAGKHSMAHRLRQQRRAILAMGGHQGEIEGLFDA